MSTAALRAAVNRLRRRLWRLVFFRMLFGEASGGALRPATRLSPTVCIEHASALVLGDDVFIGHFCFIEASAGVRIGRGTQVTNFVSIVSHSTHRAARVAGGLSGAALESATIRAPVVIGERCFIGPHSTIEAGTTLGHGTLVAAHSRVRGQFPDFAVLAGSPAQVVGDTREADMRWLADHPALWGDYERWLGSLPGGAAVETPSPFWGGQGRGLAAVPQAEAAGPHPCLPPKGEGVKHAAPFSDNPIGGRRESHLALLGDASSVHVQRWAREMQARGWRVSLVTARPQPIEGVEQILLSRVRRSSDWLWRVGEAKRAIKQLSPDIVHAHYVTSYGYLAARAGRQPLVMTAWGSDLLVTPQQSTLKRWLTAWTLRRARLVTGDSQDLLAVARAFAPGVPAQLVHWGVERSRFAPVPWRDKPADEAVSLRSWEPNYRIDAILRAFAQVRARRPGARLHLLGGGSQEGFLRKLADDLALKDAVHFHGRLDDAGMAGVLARCKLSISVPQSDATSVSVLESMACGLAVIASDLPANREWLPADALVPAGDADALAARWLALLDDDAQAAELGARNAERIARDGDRRAQMDAMDAAYRQLLPSPPVGEGSGERGRNEPFFNAATPSPQPLSREGRGAASAPLLPNLSESGEPRLVSVIAPCRNERAHIDAFCDSLLAQRLPTGWRMEALVADGLSDDGTRARLDARAAQDARLLPVDNPGRIVSTGLNACLARARGEVIARLDIHTVFAPDYIAECLAALTRSGADNVGGPWVARGQGATARAVAAAFQCRWVAGGARSRDRDYEGEADTVYLGCWPRATLARVGGFDETLVRNQDDEHNLRLRLAGGRVWQSPRIRSWYQVRGTIWQLFRQQFQYGYWRPFVMRKHGQPGSARQLVPALFALALLLAVLALPWRGGPLAALLVVYGVYLAGASSAAARQARDWTLLPRLPAVIAAYHLGYGLGTWRGLFDLLRNRRGGERLTRLTR